MIYEYIVVGGGASGLMFASSVKSKNSLLLEGSPSFGTKLLISGGGHCNITHGGSIKDFIDCYGDSGKRIRTCLYKHNNLELIKLLEDNGVETYANDEDKIFPVSMKARDILDIFISKAKANGWTLRANAKVTDIEETGETIIVTTEDQSFEARNVVIATGGITYPKTGSDGSMFEILRSLGVEVTELQSVLAPLTPVGYPYAELAGIAFPDAVVTTGVGKKNRHSYRDAVLFTHKDLSGPAILNISRYTPEGTEFTINYIPDVEDPFKVLVGKVASSHASYANIVADAFGLPKRFAEIIVTRAQGTRKATASRDGISLKGIVELLTNDRFVVETRGDNGMVTMGGVSLKEISTSTMELKNHPGIHVIGEALDIDGITGGYNLQFAYSSAMAAATRNQNC